MPLSSFFGGVQRFAGQALNRAKSTYSNIDRNLGGILPGGVDNPVIGRSRPYFERKQLVIPKQFPKGGMSFNPMDLASPFERDLGSVIDTAASKIAAAQPTVQNAITQSPGPIKSLVSTALNQAPISVNLFGRYYTGLGSEGLQLPESFLNRTRGVIENYEKGVGATKKSYEDQRSIVERDLARIKSGEKMYIDYRAANDFLAEIKSFQNKLNQGYVPIETARSLNEDNPLSALGTSIGRAFFKRTPEGGWRTNEKYDFAYGGADQNQPATVTKEEQLSPSQEFSQLTAQTLLDKFMKDKSFRGSKSSDSPESLFGRAVVSKMQPSSFDYEINIPPSESLADPDATQGPKTPPINPSSPSSFNWRFY